jgi:hypothetical protein
LLILVGLTPVRLILVADRPIGICRLS